MEERGTAPESGEDVLSDTTDDLDMSQTLEHLRTQLYWILVACCPDNFTVKDIEDIASTVRDQVITKWREKEKE